MQDDTGDRHPVTAGAATGSPRPGGAPEPRVGATDVVAAGGGPPDGGPGGGADGGPGGGATPPAVPRARRGVRGRVSWWAHDAVQPVRWTCAAIAVGFAGVMVAERASTIAPVALPLLLATGLMGALVRDGWGGPGWTWVGAALAEAFGGLAYLASRPAADAQWDGLIPLFLAGGVMLFAGLFFAAFLVTSALRRLLSRRSADRAIAAGVVGLILLAVVIGVSAPSSGDVGPSPTPPPAAGSRILRA